MRHLAFRSALRNHGDADDQFLLAVAGNSDDLLKDWESGGHVVDFEDTRLVLKTYIRRLTSGPQLHIHFLQYLIGWAMGIFDSREHADLELSLMVAHITSLWLAVNTQENVAYGEDALLMANYSFIGFAALVITVTMCVLSTPLRHPLT